MSILKVYEYNALTPADLDRLLDRNTDPSQTIQQSVTAILEEVRADGDDALRRFGEKFDRVRLDRLYLNSEEIEAIAATINRDEQRALEIAFANIHRFHSIQLRRERSIDTMPGVTCWREVRPIERVGLYVPGGSAVLPSTLLMLGVPARIAGCREIVVCSPPQADGRINGYVAYCLKLLGIERVFLIGGAQAVAAMAYGTASIPRVDKIFGPGNQYVTMAKRLIQSGTQVAIDMPAGPSEVLVIADASANPAFVAADLLAQAEHGTDSQAILVSTDAKIIEEVQSALEEQLAQLPRAETARQALTNSYAVCCNDLDEAVSFSNRYAPEHLIIETDEWKPLLPKISNAGSVFVGHLTPESVGDYASGTNHTLPTSGYARAYSGVSVESFVKRITFQHITAEGLQRIGPTIEVLAELEGLQAHRNAVSIRL